MPQSLYKTFYFHPPGLFSRLPLLFSVFFLFSSLRSSSPYPGGGGSLPLFTPTLHCLHSSLFSSLSASSLSHLLHSPLHSKPPRLALLCLFLPTPPLCSRRVFPFAAPPIAATGCTAPCWQAAAVSATPAPPRRGAPPGTLHLPPAASGQEARKRQSPPGRQTAVWHRTPTAVLCTDTPCIQTGLAVLRTQEQRCCGTSYLRAHPAEKNTFSSRIPAADAVRLKTFYLFQVLPSQMGG